MMNKFIALLILISFFGAVYGFYYYFFILNKGNLTLEGNVGGYTVEMYSEEIKTSFNSECKNSKCELIDLAPFEYTLTLTKKGYKPYSSLVKINKKETLTLNFELEKQLQVTKIMSNNEKNSQEKLDAFREINKLQKSYKFFNLDTLGYFYFVDNNDNTLSLFYKNQDSETKIYSFKKVDKNKINLFPTYQSQNEIAIAYDQNIYIYDIDAGNMIEIFFPQDINYVKKIPSGYQLVNEKGSFLYDQVSKKVEFFYTFKDFIVYDDKNYFGIIYKDETQKKANYNLSNTSDNLIVKYNFETKTIKVLETISEPITKIVQENGEIYFYNENGDTFLVDNIE